MKSLDKRGIRRIKLKSLMHRVSKKKKTKIEIRHDPKIFFLLTKNQKSSGKNQSARQMSTFIAQDLNKHTS